MEHQYRPIIDSRSNDLEFEAAIIGTAPAELSLPACVPEHFWIGMQHDIQGSSLPDAMPPRAAGEPELHSSIVAQNSVV